MFILEAAAQFSLMEIVIFGFIGANAALAGACLVQHSLKRLTDASLDR